jgi:hypothetical protein
MFLASRYVLGERRCPLEPQLYSIKATCQKEGRAFKSKSKSESGSDHNPYSFYSNMVEAEPGA